MGQETGSVADLRPGVENAAETAGELQEVIEREHGIEDIRFLDRQALEQALYFEDQIGKGYDHPFRGPGRSRCVDDERGLFGLPFPSPMRALGFQLVHTGNGPGLPGLIQKDHLLDARDDSFHPQPRIDAAAGNKRHARPAIAGHLAEFFGRELRIQGDHCGPRARGCEQGHNPLGSRLGKYGHAVFVADALLDQIIGKSESAAPELFMGDLAPHPPVDQRQSDPLSARPIAQLEERQHGDSFCFHLAPNIAVSGETVKLGCN